MSFNEVIVEDQVEITVSLTDKPLMTTIKEPFTGPCEETNDDKDNTC